MFTVAYISQSPSRAPRSTVWSAGLGRESRRSPLSQLNQVMATDGHLNLGPPLVESENFDVLLKAGQTISATLSQGDNSLAVFIKNAVSVVVCDIACSLQMCLH